LVLEIEKVQKYYSYPAIRFTQFLCKKVMDLGICHVLLGWVILEFLHVYVPSAGVQLAKTSAVKYTAYINIKLCFFSTIKSINMNTAVNKRHLQASPMYWF